MKDKYVFSMINDQQLIFEKRYKTYQEIADDWKIFGNAENVRSWVRMQEKKKKPCYKNSKRYELFTIKKLKNINICSSV